jgi:hypothetical protein
LRLARQSNLEAAEEKTPPKRGSVAVIPFREGERPAGRGVDGSFACWLRLADAASGGSRVGRRRVDELEVGRLTVWRQRAGTHMLWRMTMPIDQTDYSVVVGHLLRSRGGGRFIVPEDKARYSSRLSIFRPWRRPAGREKRPSSGCWKSSMLNTCGGRRRDGLEPCWG